MRSFISKIISTAALRSHIWLKIQRPQMTVTVKVKYSKTDFYFSFFKIGNRLVKTFTETCS